MDTVKMRFLDVFDEDEDESLILKLKLKIADQLFEKDSKFRKGEKIGGVDFHILRYFDLALEETSAGSAVYEVTGFFPTK